MTQDQKIIRAKVGLLELAKQLGNVSQAGKMMGYSRDSFYRSPLRNRWFARLSAGGRRIRTLGPSRNIETVSTPHVRTPGNGYQNRGLLFEVSSQGYPVRTPL
jgi:hypothetical protein